MSSLFITTKIPEIPETKNQELVFLKVHKNMGTCVFLGGGWPGSIRTIMFFFGRGENLICCGYRECSLKLLKLDPSQTVKTDSKEP